jgi:CTP synthase
MVIEVARDLAGLVDANSSEFDPDAEQPVIATMEEQKHIVSGSGDLGGTMRLGLYPANLADGSIVRGLYGAPSIQERHRHRYEVNNAYRDKLETAGLVFSGLSPDHELVEFIELDRSVHPYFVATQAHPELRSRPRWTGSANPGSRSRSRSRLLPRRPRSRPDDGSSRAPVRRRTG